MPEGQIRGSGKPPGALLGSRLVMLQPCWPACGSTLVPCDAASSPPCPCPADECLQYVADRCRVHPNCTGFTWREAAKPELTNSSSAVLKGCGPEGFDPRQGGHWERCRRRAPSSCVFEQQGRRSCLRSRENSERLSASSSQPAQAGLLNGCPTCRRVNWNPGLSLFVKEGVTLEPAATLQTESADKEQPASDKDSEVQAAADEAAADVPPAGPGTAALSPGAVAGIAAGSAVAVVAAAAAAGIWYRREQRLRPGGAAGTAPRASHMLPAAHPPAVGQLKAKSSLLTELPELSDLQIDVGEAAAGQGGGRVVQASAKSAAISSPRRRGAGGSPGCPSLPAVPAPVVVRGSGSSCQPRLPNGGSTGWPSLPAAPAGGSPARPGLPAAPTGTQPSRQCSRSSPDRTGASIQLEGVGKGISVISEAVGSGTASQEGLVARLLGQAGSEALQGMLVPQEAVACVRRPDGGPVSLGQGG